MRVSYVLIFILSAVSTMQALSATLEQLLPWLSPNSLAMGTSFSNFQKSHPDAKNPFIDAPPTGAFSGEMFEGSDSDSLRIYGFLNGELASVAWSSSDNVAGTLPSVRNALLLAHGSPTVENAARMDSLGSIAKVIREVYRPTIDKNCVVCLLATSEGVEVDITDEAIFKKNGREASRQSFEAAVQTVSKADQPNPKPSDLVDYLAAERKNAETPRRSANATPRIPQPPPPSTPSPGANPMSSTPIVKALESPAPVIERTLPMWIWVVGFATLIVIGRITWRKYT